MADYNSIYSGQEIDESVGRALNPDSAPTAGSQALVTSGGVKSALNQKADSADLGALEQTVQTQGGKISTIEGKIPTAASPSNQLADKGFVTAGLGTKQDTIQDLEQIRTRANEGHTAYQKPSGGIPKADLDSGVQTSLGKADTAVQPARVEAIEEKIPAQASSENKLADKNFVNSTVATATATFRGTYNLVSDLGLTVTATQQQIAAAIVTKLAALGITADNNDYVFVQIPTANDKPTEIARVDRYKYNGTAWSFEYSINNSGFTAAQWAAINSGITSALVAAFNAKYDKPSGGIPNSDLAGDIAKNKLASDVQTSLGKADNAAPQSTTYTKTEVDTELAKKADKDTDAVSGNLAKFDANGNPVDGGISADALQKAIPQKFAEHDAELDGIKKNLFGKEGRRDITARSVDTEELFVLGTPYILIGSTTGAPSAANIPTNWDEDTMGMWDGTPRFIGQEYVTTDGVFYKAYRITHSTGDWKALN